MTTINSTTPAAATTAKSSSAMTGTTSAADQQDRFMKLLVAQMKNQDPLNPMDNAQMTSQVAQINTVAGIEKLNTTVESLLGGFYALQAQSATSLPGRDVLVEGKNITLAEGAATGGVQLAGEADSVKVDILDAGGATLRTLDIGASPAGTRSFQWDGKTTSGEAAADGSYRMRVTATKGGKAVEAATLAGARVAGVSTGSTGLQVDLGSAGVRGYGDIKSFL